MSVVVTNDMAPMRIKIQATTVIDAGRVRMASSSVEAMLAAARAVKPHVGGH